MGTLYIDRKDLYVKTDGNALAFYINGVREGIVPIVPLKRVVVVGNVTFESMVMHKLALENISVIFLSGKRARFCGMLHGRLHNNGMLRIMQYRKSLLPFALEISRELVSKKIQAQAALLKDAIERRADLRFPLTNALKVLENMVPTIDSEDPFAIARLIGLEGGAAASYFQAYTTMFPPSLEFNKRNRRPPEDPVNAMLSFCYTLLHFELVREIEVIGLDPTIGLYHQFEYGRESLACDMVEPFRPEVDRLVWHFFRDRVFTERDFAEDDERPGCYLKKEGRKKFYELYEEWAKEMRPKFTAAVRDLARRIMDGQDPVPE